MKLLPALLALALFISAPVAPLYAEEKPAQSAGDGEYEKSVLAMVTEAEKLGVLFAGVKDEATAKSALPHITAAVNAMEAARAKGKSLGTPSPAASTNANAKYGARLQKAMTTLATEANRINGNPGASGVMKESLAKALKK